MREGIADGWAGMMRGGETCSALGCPGGSFGARRVFKTGNKWDGMREGTCWRNQDGEIGGDWVSACGPCLSQIRRADKTGRKGLLDRRDKD